MKTLERDESTGKTTAEKETGRHKIYIIDDHPIMVQGLKELIDSQTIETRTIGWH